MRSIPRSTSASQIDGHASLRRVAQLLTAADVGALVVIEGEGTLGVVSERDVVGGKRGVPRWSRVWGWAMDGHAPVELGDLQVSAPERLGAGVAEYARRKIGSLGRYTPEPVLHARVRLTVHADPAVLNPVIAQGNLDVNGRLVRVQVAAPTASEAVDALHDRLRRRLDRKARSWQARRGGQPTSQPHEWRHGSKPARRPGYFPRSPAERELVRRKTFELPKSTVDEAAADMDLLDYDFHLFREAGSGQDSVLYRVHDGLRLAQVTPLPERVRRGSQPVSVSPQPAVRLDLTEAVRRLELGGQPFLFFLDAEAKRARLLYHRYDGHYGLIMPADERGVTGRRRTGR